MEQDPICHLSLTSVGSHRNVALLTIKFIEYNMRHYAIINMLQLHYYNNNMQSAGQVQATSCMVLLPHLHWQGRGSHFWLLVHPRKCINVLIYHLIKEEIDKLYTCQNNKQLPPEWYYGILSSNPFLLFSGVGAFI